MTAQERKYSASGFPVEIKRAYAGRVRITMRHAGRLMQVVDRKDKIGAVISAMRSKLNHDNYCPTCGAVR